MTNQEEFLLKQQNKYSIDNQNKPPAKRNSFNFNLNLNFLESNWESELDLISKEPGVIDTSNPNYISTRKKLRNLLLKKSPDKNRAKYWFLLSGAEREKNLHPGYYHNIIYEYPDYIPSKYKTIIEADLDRTCPTEDFFKKPENRKKLSNVLIAYSRRNCKIGYCQGFNFIVAKLLQIFEEEDAFWLFVQIIENILPCEYYSELVGIMGYCSLCLRILTESNKKVMLKIKNFEVILNNLLYKWFISLFIENTSHETFLNVWDALMLDGNIVLLRAVSSILDLMEEQILQADGFEELTKIFEEKISKYNCPRDKFMKLLLNEGKLRYSNAEIEEMREEINREAINTIIKTKKNEKKKIQVDINGEEIECDLDYPFCLKEFEDDTKKIKRYLPVDKTMIGDNPITPEDKEKLKKQFNNEEIKEFKLKNIQVVQTFRIMDNPINFVSNYFRINNELKEENFISNEIEEIIPEHEQKSENNLGQNILNINNNNKNISVSDKLKQQIYFYKNMLIHRDEHFCKKKKHISEEILKQDSDEELSKSIASMKNATQNFLLNITKEKEKNKKDITKMIGNIHKNFNAGSELELLDSNQNKNIIINNNK
jgi:hypothetical protein